MINIDKNIIYKTEKYIFKNFVQLSLEEKLKILDWRNDVSIRKWMYNSDILQLDDHLRFIDSLNWRNDCYYWVVCNEDDPIGVINITNVDIEQDKAELGYYLVPGLLGEGFFFVRECFYFFFKVLKIKTFYGAVNEDNIEAIMLDEFFGCKFMSSKILSQNGVDVKYLVCEGYSPVDFSEKYNLSIVEYIKYVKNGNRKIHSKLC